MGKARHFLIGLAVLAFRVEGYETNPPVSPEIAAKPIPIVYWVMPGVIPVDESATIDSIWAGLQDIEAIPTSCLRFTAFDTLRTSTQPVKQPGQLLIIIGNSDDLSSGGASLPVGGQPGTWYGAVAEKRIGHHLVGMHEVGHALGLGHSTISFLYPRNQLPVMHWAASADHLLPDDIAAFSVLYPEPTRPISKETACITGRMMSAGARSTPIPGVNVVAIRTDGVPVIARLSKEGMAAGEFDLCGLPPATYDIRFMDGQSYHGGMYTSSVANALTSAQIHNYAEPTPLRRTVTAGQIENLGDILLAIEKVRADSLLAGAFSGSSRFTNLTSTVLPPAPLNKPYEMWLHLRGGVRQLLMNGTQGLPAGVNVVMGFDERTTGSRWNGNHFLHIVGTPTVEGVYNARAYVRDLRGIVDTVAFSLTVGSPAGLAAGGFRKSGTGKTGAPGHDALGRLPQLRRVPAKPTTLFHRR